MTFPLTMEAGERNLGKIKALVVRGKITNLVT